MWKSAESEQRASGRIINQCASSSHTDLQMFHKLSKNSEIQSKHIRRFTNMCECSFIFYNESVTIWNVFFLFMLWLSGFGQQKKKCHAMQLPSYLHYRNPDDTANTFLNVRLATAQTVRPQKEMTAKIDRSHDWPSRIFSCHCITSVVNYEHVKVPLGTEKSGAAYEPGEFGNNAKPEGRIHKKPFFFCCSEGIVTEHVISAQRTPKHGTQWKEYIYVLLAMISG